MIAAAGARLLARGVRDALDLNAFSRVPVGEAPWRPAVVDAAAGVDAMDGCGRSAAGDAGGSATRRASS
jgi:hypothetical protein